MRTPLKPPTDEDIALSKKLRGICEHFKMLSQSDAHATAYEQAKRKDREDSNFLAPVTVIAINNYIREHDITNGDLMTIRNTPGKWCRGNPYDWLWMLHRYTNKYSRQ